MLEINFQDKEGKYLPKVSNNLPAKVAQRVWQGCPARFVDFPSLNKFVFGPKAKSHPYLGHHKSLYIAYATNKETRRQGSSGGILTAILLWLLETNQIDGAVVLGFDPKNVISY